jgi:N-acetyltransferase
VGLRPDGPLVGRFVRLEPLEERHREGLRAAAADDPRIFRFTAMMANGFDAWFDATRAAGIGGDVPFVQVAEGREAGSTSFLGVELGHRRAEIGGKWLERARWGRGVNVEAKYLLLEQAFEGAGLMRVEFKTDARNLRTRGALLAIGARFEGLFRKHMVLPDSIRDSAWYAILDDEWPEVKARLRMRLDSLDRGERAR